MTRIRRVVRVVAGYASGLRSRRSRFIGGSTLLILVWGSILPVAPVVAADENEPTQAEDPLTKELDKVRRRFGLNRAVAVLVETLDDNRVVYQHAPDRRFIPASGMKLIVMAASLHYLGPSFRFETNFYTDGTFEQGAVRGNLYVKGSGDPSLTHKELDYIVRTLTKRGVRSIEGHLILDDTFFDDRMRGPASYENIYKEGLPIQSALSYNFNLVEFLATPSSTGTKANVHDRGYGYFTMTNRVTTAGRGRPWLTVRRVARDRVVVRGRVIEGDKEPIRRRLVSPNPPMYFGTALAGKLREQGVAFEGEIIKGVVPDGAGLLYRYESDRLVEVLGALGRYSNNFSAEQMLKALGAHRWGEPGSFESGTRAVGEYLVGLGFSADEFRLLDGSGLSPDNLLTPRILVRVLQEVWNDPTLRTEFLCSLSIGGVEGTLRRRYLNERHMGYVVAKTGSLAAVSSLSGIAFTDSRGPVVFSVITNGIGRQARADHVEDTFVRTLLDHVDPRTEATVSSGTAPSPDKGESALGSSSPRW